MIIEIYDCAIREAKPPANGIMISRWVCRNILNWADEKKLEKVYKEYVGKNLEYLEIEITKENSEFYTIKNKSLEDIEMLSRVFCEDLQNIKNYKKDKRIIGNVSYFIDYFARENLLIIPAIIKDKN